MKRYFLSLVSLLLLAGCQSTQHVDVAPQQYLHDTVFPAFDNVDVEDESQIFALSEEALRFVNNQIDRTQAPDRQMASLIDAIFDRSSFDLLYMGDANTVADETFRRRAANCLSLSIMTYAMGRKAGFEVKFQEILVPEYWTRRDGYSLLNGHINLVMSPRSLGNVIHLIKQGYVVDFDRQADRKHFPKRYVEVDTVMAMFYNNKGADALMSRDLETAYAYFRSAVMKDPQFDGAWVNLGLLYRQAGRFDWAEDAYQVALKLDEHNLTAWENLAYLYDLSGRSEKARDIMARLEVKRKDNPFYHFILGEQEFDNQNFEMALTHYRKALQLDKSKHEIYYGLAKTHFQLGNVLRSQRYFRLAKKRSRNSQDQERYQSKLDKLSRS